MTSQPTRTLFPLLMAMTMLAFACGDAPNTGSATALGDPAAPADDHPPSDVPVEPANNTPNEPDEPIEDPQDPPPEDPQEPPEEPVEEPPVELTLDEPDWWVHIGNEERNTLQAIAAGPQGHSAVLIERISANTPATLRSSITPDAVETSGERLFRFDPEGHLQSTTDLPFAFTIKSMAMDSAQNLIVVAEINRPAELGDTLLEPSNRNVVIIKLDPDNAVQWVQTWDNDTNDHCRAVAISNNDAVAVACTINNKLTLAVYEPDGAVRFERSFGRISHSEASSPLTSITWHNDTHLGITGVTNQSIDMNGDGQDDITHQGQTTAVVGVYDAHDGHHIWSQGIGGPMHTIAGSLDIARKCSFDQRGNFIATVSVYGYVEFEDHIFGAEFEGVNHGIGNDTTRTSLVASWNPETGQLNWLREQAGRLFSNDHYGPMLHVGGAIEQLSLDTGQPIITIEVPSGVQPIDGPGDIYTFALIEADTLLVNELDLDVHTQPDALLRRFSLPIMVP